MDIVFAVTLIGIAGIGAQWVAWRMNLPAIVLMAIAGLLLGPVFGLLRPEETFGEVYGPLVSMAVGIILFEGGLQLKFDELREVGKGVRRLVVPGVFFAWGLGFLAAWKIAGLSAPTALIFSGIMVVTGPTVIMPLLRQAKLSSRPATLLRWEGIVNDPIGALFAVFVYEVLHLSDPAHGGYEPATITGSLIIGATLATVFGVLAGLFIARSFRNGWVPEFLKTPVLLATVLAAFALANGFQEEAGLLAVTAMGITIANAKLPSINQLLHFKENIAVMFVSGVFVMLTANLTPDVLFSLTFADALFVIAMLFVVRPVAAITSLLGTNTTWKERLLMGWIAPRGIVAVAVCGLFAVKMVDLGYADAEKLVPLSFAMVFATVLAHGFTIGPLAKRLDLAQRGRPGVLIAGASSWSAALGEKLKEMKYPVLVVDSSYRSLRPARNRGLETFYGEILSEVTEHHIEFVRYNTLLAVSGNDSHNALVCMDLAPEMDRARTFQLATGKNITISDSRRMVSYTLQGRALLSKPLGLDELMERHYNGWGFQVTRITETYDAEAFLTAIGDESVIVAVERDKELLFVSNDKPLTPRADDRVLAYVPPSVLEGRRKREEEVPEEIEEAKEEALEKLDEGSGLTTA
ncbi:sodium:proton antiporter [Parvularcula sp. ZS-1/3]|uniref:Sodium:proton antiporter n=1 Tax=Parvularcula mediterranea TaxID=2732508 RepID=A0A7Y3RJL7_9PROT|nr:sodium:proton antiporter [Parvularcula mediterranea]NNU15299.1 sodium:proton antiporter [Parvularcula mediterranea]